MNGRIDYKYFTQKLATAGNWLKKTFRSNAIRRLEMFFASIIIVLAVLLSYLITNNIGQVLIDNQLRANSIVLNNLYSQFDKNVQSAYSVLSQIYHDKSLGFELFEFLESASSDYLEKHPLENKALIDSLKVLVDRDKTIAAITIYQRNIDLYYQYTGGSSQIIQLVNMPKLYNDMKRYDFGPRILPLVEAYNKPRFGVLYKLISPISYTDQGSVLIEYDMDDLRQSVAAYNASQIGTILILDNSGVVIFNSTGKYTNAKYPYFKTITNANGKGYINLDEKSIVGKLVSTKAHLLFLGITPYTQIRQAIDPTLKTIYVITGMIIVVMLVVYFFSMRTLASRVNKVLEGIGRVQQGDLKTRIYLSTRNKDDEIFRIAESFNTMCSELLLNIEKTVKAQMRQKNAELESLQAKINPHFLYNTLEAIRMRANNDGNKETADMIYLFALMFRNLFRGEMFIPIEHEIESCRIYIEMFLIRYENNFSAAYFIDTDASQFMIPKNTLQPIIENYFIHGYEPTRPDNHINIRCTLTEGMVSLSVEDNGKGIGTEVLAGLNAKFCSTHVKEKDSIGLTNVNERLKLVFGEQHGIVVESGSIGTKVMLRFPAVTKDPMMEMGK